MKTMSQSINSDPSGASNIDRDVVELRILKQNGFYGVTLPVIARVEGTTAATAGNYTAPFFIANRDYYVISITERHETAGTDGSAVTMQVKKVPSGTAPGSGTDLLATAINLKSTANTNQSPALSTTQGVLLIPAGYGISMVTTGTLTSVAGVTLSVLLKAV